MATTLYIVEGPHKDEWHVNDTSYRSLLDDLWLGHSCEPYRIRECSDEAPLSDISERVAMDLLIRARDEYSPINERKGLLNFVQQFGHCKYVQAA